MFSYNTGIKLISAATNIDAHSLSKSLHVLAKLRVTQSADTITFTAQEELRIKAGGSFTTLSASGITHGTAGQWDVKAATQGIQTVGKSAAVVMPKISKGNPKLELSYYYDDLQPVAGAPYKVTFASGAVMQGTLDAQGRATLLNPPDGAYVVEYGQDPRPFKPEDEPEDKSYIRADVQSQAKAQMQAEHNSRPGSKA